MNELSKAQATELETIFRKAVELINSELDRAFEPDSLLWVIGDHIGANTQSADLQKSNMGFLLADTANNGQRLVANVLLSLTENGPRLSIESNPAFEAIQANE